MLVLLAGCIWDAALYHERHDALTDDDGDGVNEDGGDCDDGDPDVVPGAAELCDGRDQDCDLAIDEGLDETWYLDGDGDDFGTTDIVKHGCLPVTGYSLSSGDCGPSDPAIHPGAPETPYDGVDQDCDGADLTDVDGDGHDMGDDDCDDADPAVYAGAAETWDDDGVDNDCDGDATEAITWDASSAVTRIDGAEPGSELGRRMQYWPDAPCLFVSAPYAESGRGVVYAEVPAAPGPRFAGGNGWVIGSDPYGYLTPGGPLSQAGMAAMAEPGASVSAGIVYIVDGERLCEGGAGSVADLADQVLEGAEPGAFLGAETLWIPDVDGDGRQELLATAPLAAGGGSVRGEVRVWFAATLDAGATTADAADIVLTGGWDEAELGTAWVAEDVPRDTTYLVLSQRAPQDAQPGLLRLPLAGLRSGSPVDLATGALLTGDRDRALTTTWLGDIDGDGVDELSVGTGVTYLWGVDEIVGTQQDTDTRGWVLDDDPDEYIPNNWPLGDLDGDDLADFFVDEEDWPDGTTQGRGAIFLGDRTTTANHVGFDDIPHRLVGDEAGDQFGYAAVPVGDFDTDGRADIAVAAYGSDIAGVGAGTVYIVPVP
jgi:hypothetical protein